MVLVDTSVWIDYFGSRPTAAIGQLDELMANGIPFALTPIVMQEILQGARSPREFARLRRALTTQHILHPLDPIESHVGAADIYARCRRSGFTPRGAIDCLIAQIAIEHQAPLLHNDADFQRIARVVPELRIH